MKWKKYTITTTTQAEDVISSMLADLGVEGVWIEDNIPISQEEKEQLFIDILPEIPKDEGIARLSFFLEEERDESETKERKVLLSRIAEEMEELRAFMDIGEGRLLIGESEDDDWLYKWKEYFKPFSIGNIYIRPSWQESLPKEKDFPHVITIDPGTSFGTGQHATTSLCIEGLQKHLKTGNRVLDVGCGSGILSIAALRLGAREVVATDIDPLCIACSKENLERNGCFGVTLHLGDVISECSLREKITPPFYDIVVSNILAEVIVDLAPVVKEFLLPRGTYIASGILKEKEDMVVSAMKTAGFEILEIQDKDEWICVTAR
ncbi:ribosomal protein L11 methyltransferase [Clostridia bacterium]|nr:ribosomal protein L11 methyltransferase [Clostridia bacterium]